MPKISPQNVTALKRNTVKDPKHKSNISRLRAVPSAPNHEIAFINLTDSSGPTQNAEKRKLVRAHVMRGYQRQRQAQEEEESRQFQENRPSELKAPLTTIFTLPRTDSAQQDVMENTDGFGEDDWTATLDFRPNRFQPKMGSVPSQQIEGEWVPVTDFETEKNTAISIYSADGGFDQSYSYNSESDRCLASNSQEYFQQPELVPEEIECPLISRSLAVGLTFSTLNSGKLDPFNAVPGLRNSRAQALMYHYNKVLVNTLIPVNPKDKWFNYAISDNALFHATMLHSAGHNSMLAGNNDLADPFELKVEAMRLINQRLDDPVLSISDLTIGAVVCLVLFENQSGNVNLSNIHMEGLRRMVNLRGGIQNLGLSGVLQRKVLWAEVCNAMLSLSQPRLNLPQAAKALAIASASFPTPYISLFQRTSNESYPAESCGCDRKLAEIIIDLQKLSDEPPINALDGAITDHLYLVERRLVTMLDPRNSCRHSPACHSFNSPCLLAALTFVYTYLRDFPIQSPLFNAFVERLSNSLFTVDMSFKWKEDRYPVLLWVLTVGALAATGRPERSRFVIELERISFALGISSFGHFMNSLRMIVWSNRSEDGGASWKRLWGEVEDRRMVRLADVIMIDDGPALKGSIGT